jgi:hypothetical protein
MWPFSKPKQTSTNPRATRDLSPDVLQESAKRHDLFEMFELFLIRRVEAELSLEDKRAEIRLRTAEADAQTKLKLEELRQQRKQLRASQASERNRTYARDQNGRLLPRSQIQQTNGCAVCQDPGSAHLTVDQIRMHHAAGHPDSVPRTN